jgi:hypothetical protein
VNRRMRLMLDLKKQVETAEEAVEGRRRIGGNNRTGLGLDEERSKPQREIKETEMTAQLSDQQLYDGHKERLESMIL